MTERSERPPPLGPVRRLTWRPSNLLGNRRRQLAIHTHSRCWPSKCSPAFVYSTITHHSHVLCGSLGLTQGFQETSVEYRRGGRRQSAGPYSGIQRCDSRAPWNSSWL